MARSPQKKLLNRMVPIFFILALLNNHPALSMETPIIETPVQDFIIITEIKLEGSSTNLIPSLIEKYNTQYKPDITFPGGATFKQLKDLKGQSVDYWNVLVNNLTVIPGIIKCKDISYLGVIVSPDISKTKRTLGLSDAIEIDLTSMFPVDIKFGTRGTICFTLIQFLADGSSTTDNNSVFELIKSRASKDLVQIPYYKGNEFVQVYNFPFVVSEGSKALKWWGKGMIIVGATGGGALGGASLGTAGLGIGIIAGGILGGSFGLLASLGEVIVCNTDGDETNEALLMPDKPVPDYNRALKSPEYVENRIDIRKKIDINILNETHNYYYINTEAQDTEEKDTEEENTEGETDAPGSPSYLSVGQ